MEGNNTTEVSDSDAWTARLVSEVNVNVAPQWVRDLITRGFPKTAVVVGYLKWDRERSMLGAYQ